MPELGVTAYRPPYAPVTFGAVAGRRVGPFYAPERQTPMQPWHQARGAAFEIVGEWRRPWYYPQPGEAMADAVAREVRAVRNAVGVLDAGTLGKIDIQGRDAAAFLDRITINAWGGLGIGRCRYGLMLGDDGMVKDDGVTTRLGESHFHMTTTSGNAGAVLAWLEEWLQTEWPDLKVYCTSVTEQWSTVAVVGPRSRDVIRMLAPDIAVDAESFPFMARREGPIAGMPGFVSRISFSGELAFEINTPATHGLAMWEAVMEAGSPFNITPYGTETMHVLRAEKGFIIVGQETDGTQTPYDLGMSWIVSDKKGDFIGKRSYKRADTWRKDRKQLVGLLPEDTQYVIPEGAQVVAADVKLPAPAGDTPVGRV